MAGWNEWVPGTNMTLSEVLDALKSASIGLDVKDKLYWSFFKVVQQAIKEGNANFDVEMAKGIYSTLKDRLDAGDNDLRNISVDWINWNLGKIGLANVDLELLQAIAGTAPVNATPAAGSVTLTQTAFSKVVSKNQFDLASAKISRLLADGTVSFDTTTFYTSTFMKFDPGEVVKMNFSLQSSATYDSSLSPINVILNTAHTQVTMPANGVYLKVTRASNRIDEFMVYTGSAPAGYDPFKRAIDGMYITGVDGEEIKDKSIPDSKLDFISSGKNLLNPTEVFKGVYLNPDNGALQNNVAYDTTHVRKALPNEKYTITHPRFVVFFDENNNIMPTESITHVSPPPSYTITLPPNAYGYQYSYLAIHQNMQIEKGDTATPYEPYAKTLNGISINSSNVIKYGSQVTKSSSKGSLTDGQRLTAGSVNSLKKNKTYSFSANITSFYGVRMGQGETDYGGSYIEVTASELRFFDYRGAVTPRAILNHGLTIANFIDVLITIDKDAKATVRIMTNGGFYESPAQNWEGYNGTPFAKSMGSALTDGEFVFDTSDFKKPIYFFGDSYAGMTSADRWPNYIRSWGFDNWLVNGFPGQASLSAKGMLDFALSKGNPKILIWGMGMNDADSASAVNANWLNTFNQVKAICEARGIELVLCTIPNVPIVNNSFKNDVVRNSGYRFIDFAKAVGGESVGSGWYTGMLSADNIHPATLGAQKLALRALQDVPELAGV